MSYPAVEFDALPSDTRDLYKENAVLGEIFRATIATLDPGAGIQRAVEILHEFFATCWVGAWFFDGDHLQLLGVSIPAAMPPEVATSIASAFQLLPLEAEVPVTRALRSRTVLHWRANDPSLDRGTQDALAALGAGQLYAFPIILEEAPVGCSLVALPEGRLLGERDQGIVRNVLEHLARLHRNLRPRAPPLADPRERRVSASQAVGRQRPRVMLVEGDAITAEVIQHRFERQGLDVHHCGTGEAAASAFADVEPDLCIIELKLEDMEGLELLEYIRGNTKGRQVPVIVLTSLASEKMVARAFSLGADDYVLKPFSFTELMARVRRRLAVDAISG